MPVRLTRLSWARALRGLALLTLVLVFLAPLLVLLGGSLHAPGSAPVMAQIWPDQPGLAAYHLVFDWLPFERGLANSLLWTALAVPLVLITASWAGLGARLLSTAQRRGLLVLLLSATALPWIVVGMPRFLLFQALGLGGSGWPLLAPALFGGSPFFVLLYVVSTARLDEAPIAAARLEGLGWLRIWWQVIWPQLRLTHLAVGVLAAVQFWGAHQDALLYLDVESRQTAPLLLHSLQIMGPSHWSVMLAGALLIALPMLALLLLALGRWRSPPGAALVLLMLPMLLLAGCSRPAAETAPATIILQAFADPVESRAYRALIAAFEADNPDVRVTLIPVGRQEDHMTRLTTAFAAGRPPDLFLVNFRRYGQLVARDLIEPIEPRLRALGAYAEADFFAPAIEAFQHRGELLCMPQNVSSLAVYWNRALFAAHGVPPPTPDWTWKDFHDTARALTLDLDGDGRKDIFGLDFEPSLIVLAPFVWQAGGRLVDDVQRPSRIALRSQDAAVGLMFLKRLRNEAGVMPSLAERRAENPDARFIRGGLAMTLHSRRLSASLRAAKNLDWDVAALPRHKYAATTLHSDAYCLARASAQPEAAARFVAFAASETGQSLLSQSGRIVPSRRSVALGPAFLDPDQPPASARIFIDAIPNMRRTPNTRNWFEIEQRVNPVIEEWVLEVPNSAELGMGLADGHRLAGMIRRIADPLLAQDLELAP